MEGKSEQNVAVTTVEEKKNSFTVQKTISSYSPPGHLTSLMVLVFIQVLNTL
jgi:hypothetical protein